jgi:hypothetical protein
MTEVASQPRRVPLSKDQLELISWVEQYWNQHGKFPPVGSIRSRFPYCDDDLALEPVRMAMANRGIRIPVGDTYPSELTQEQLACVAVVLDWSDRRSHATKLKSMGVNATKWNGWMKNPVFKEYVHGLSTRNLDDALHVAHEGLVNATAKGSVDAIKYYMELTGRYTSDSGQMANFKVMVQRMVESIQRHVKDQDIIRLIASDFEVIMKGETPQTQPVLDRSSI